VTVSRSEGHLQQIVLALRTERALDRVLFLANMHGAQICPRITVFVGGVRIAGDLAPIEKFAEHLDAHYGRGLDDAIARDPEKAESYETVRTALADEYSFAKQVEKDRKFEEEASDKMMEALGESDAPIYDVEDDQLIRDYLAFGVIPSAFTLKNAVVTEANGREIEVEMVRVRTAAVDAWFLGEVRFI
jgi:hypothetical protein